MTDLDDLAALRRLDPQRMDQRIAELPDQCRRAWELVQAWSPPRGYDRVAGVAILGMGGSAIGGDLARGLAAPHSPIPIFVMRDDQLPRFVDSKYLVIASSYSGDTEETLAAFAETLRRGAKTVAVTTGGRLAERATNSGSPLLRYNYPAQPRAALGYSLVLLLGILYKVGLVPDPASDLEEAIRLLQRNVALWREESATPHNQAKQLARALVGKLPLIYAAQHLAAAARRWKTQFNENSKSLAAFETLPELNHNAVEGYLAPREVLERSQVLLLDSRLYHPRIQARLRATEEILEQRDLAQRRVEAAGDSALAQVLWAVQLGDYTSYFLAALNGLDPTPVANIAYLKERLGSLSPAEDSESRRLLC